jgi:hypothetical protein
MLELSVPGHAEQLGFELSAVALASRTFRDQASSAANNANRDAIRLVQGGLRGGRGAVACAAYGTHDGSGRGTPGLLDLGVRPR